MSKLAKFITGLLLVLLLALQYRYWFGDGSVRERKLLAAQIAAQQTENQQQAKRNKVMEAEIIELKQGLETVEERARHELGMIKQGETLYLLMD